MKRTLFFIVINIVLLAACKNDSQQPLEVNDETEILRLINENRDTLKLPLMVMNEQMQHIARQHSIDMAEGVAPYNTEGWEQRKQQMPNDIKITVYDEIIGSGGKATEIYRAWYLSDKNRKYIEGDYQVVGIGSAANSQGILYVTMILINNE